MKRRSIFKLACCAVAASAIEVMGWTGVPVIAESEENPDYAPTEYYDEYYFNPDALKRMFPQAKAFHTSSPTRYVFVDGKWQTKQMT